MDENNLFTIDFNKPTEFPLTTKQPKRKYNAKPKKYIRGYIKKPQNLDFSISFD